MTSIHRINAIIAYTNNTTSYYTSANDGTEIQISSGNFNQIESQVYSWPPLRNFMSGLGLFMPSAIDISNIADIAWIVTMTDETGRNVIDGFEASTSGTASDMLSSTNYSLATFDSFGDDVSNRTCIEKPCQNLDVTLSYDPTAPWPDVGVITSGHTSLEACCTYNIDFSTLALNIVAMGGSMVSIGGSLLAPGQEMIDITIPVGSANITVVGNMGSDVVILTIPTTPGSPCGPC